MNQDGHIETYYNTDVELESDDLEFDDSLGED